MATISIRTDAQRPVRWLVAAMASSSRARLVTMATLRTRMLAPRPARPRGAATDSFRPANSVTTAMGRTLTGAPTPARLPVAAIRSCRPASCVTTVTHPPRPVAMVRRPARFATATASRRPARRPTVVTGVGMAPRGATMGTRSQRDALMGRSPALSALLVVSRCSERSVAAETESCRLVRPATTATA